MIEILFGLFNILMKSDAILKRICMVINLKEKYFLNCYKLKIERFQSANKGNLKEKKKQLCNCIENYQQNLS